jgi:hypothetical protein
MCCRFIFIILSYLLNLKNVITKLLLKLYILINFLIKSKLSLLNLNQFQEYIKIFQVRRLILPIYK